MATATGQTFQEFLQELAGRHGGPEVRARREEWVQAVERLLGRMEGWLKQSDPTGVLAVHRGEVEREEVGLGSYAAPELVIRAGKQRAVVTPVGRNTRFPPPPLVYCLPELDRPAGGRRLAGSVDVGNSSQRWNCYRIMGTGGEEAWWAVKRGLDASQDRVLADIDRPQFEAMLQDVLS